MVDNKRLWLTTSDYGRPQTTMVIYLASQSIDRKVNGHLFVCYGYRICLCLRFFYWILELFQQCGIFFIIIIFILFTMSVPDVVRSKLEIYTVKRQWLTTSDYGRPQTTMVDHKRLWLTTSDYGRPQTTMVDHKRLWLTTSDYG
jgi:hypothetical protein